MDPEQLRTDFSRFMMSYRSGIAQLMTRVRVLEDEFTHINLNNPIEHVTSRLKTPESIMRKAQRIGIPLTLDDVRANVLDIAGVRITCSFISDTYRVADMITGQPDIEVREVEDYIAHPKPNGYKSLHLIVEVPVYMSDRVQQVPIELQIRTIAMDFWASLEHKIYYKFNREVPPELLAELTEAAETAHRLDMKMERLNDEFAKLKAQPGVVDDAPELALPPQLLDALNLRLQS
ncbi:GTP pyrophosphokinase family protein [Rhodococcus sp. ABRD24]|uniref:GTP pyrophosphokinase n=1 Tax=Rhodococcus sp. ABRD24 TaxID=2507582 RepID=UPI0010400609|nr:GTP pyrophosphokinase family protein [Rhodococcus sp. ABRD24]QBJ95798.1 GTP pyrophosphokinase family protein [Rhodococcus sp. ABRD24]